jgi:hypothetical protein
MRKLKISFFWLVFLIVGGILHYVLPQHDIVRVTSTEVIRTDFTWVNRRFYAQADSGAAELGTRDLRLINTEKKNTFLFGFVARESTEVMVYRNEDTGWIWPPYFKFDSSNLQAEAAAEVSTAGTDHWAVLTHYGWRNKYMSVYPNAIGIRAVDGPDVRIIPWFNIFFFVFLVIAYLFLRAVWRQFRQRTIDPAMQDMSDGFDAAGDALADKRSRIRRWLDTWRK